MRRWAFLFIALQAFGNTGAYPFWTPARDAKPAHLWLTVYGDPIGEYVDWAKAPSRIEFFDAPDDTKLCPVPSPCVTLGELRWWAAARGRP